MIPPNGKKGETKVHRLPYLKKTRSKFYARFFGKLRRDMAKIDRVQEVSIELLRPYERNAKIHGDDQIDAIKRSIKEFGFISPCLIDKDFNIIAGHGRVIASKQLGLKKIPCVFIEGLTEQQRKAYILADNRLTEMGEWDFDKIQIELEELSDLDFDISLTGFELNEEETTDVIEDDFSENVEPKAKIGDLYQLGGHRLMCDDSTDASVIDRLMGGAKADMVFTDPPYGISIVNDKGKVGAENLAKNRTYSKVIADDTTETAQDAYGILSTLCDKLIIWGGNYFLDFLPPSDGWIVWDKRRDMTSNNFADGEMAWCSFHTPVRIYHQLWNGMIREGEHEDRVHPTQKPVKMLGEVLQDFSKENEVIVDVFGGSGSTLIACEQLNRKCYMCEIDPHYVDVIINRWETFTGKKAVKIDD